jgi:hypothetical protein
MVALIVLWHFPTKPKVEQWIAEQQEAVRNEVGG